MENIYKLCLVLLSKIDFTSSINFNDNSILISQKISSLHSVILSSIKIKILNFIYSHLFRKNKITNVSESFIFDYKLFYHLVNYILEEW